MYDVILFFIVWQSVHATHSSNTVRYLFRFVKCVCVCFSVCNAFAPRFNAWRIYGNTSNNFRLSTSSCDDIDVLHFVSLRMKHVCIFDSCSSFSKFLICWVMMPRTTDEKNSVCHHIHIPCENVQTKRCFIVHFHTFALHFAPSRIYSWYVRQFVISRVAFSSVFASIRWWRWWITFSACTK